MKNGILFVLSGPSAVGKSSLGEYIIMRWGTQYAIERARSYTTRAPRKAHESEYYFITPEEFDGKKKNNFFIETTVIYGNQYGLGRDITQILTAGRSLIAITDTSGAQKILVAVPSAVTLWIDVSRDELLSERLSLRGTETAQQCTVRTAQRMAEREQARSSGIYKYYVLNDTYSMRNATINSVVSQLFIVR